LALEEIELKYKGYEKVLYGYEYEDIEAILHGKKHFKKLTDFIEYSIISPIKLIVAFVNILFVKGLSEYEQKTIVGSYKSLLFEYFLNYEILNIDKRKKYYSNQTKSFINCVDDEDGTCRIQISTKLLPCFDINKLIGKVFKEVDNIYSIYQFSTTRSKISDLIRCIKLYRLYQNITNKLPNEFEFLFKKNHKIHNFFIDYFNFKAIERIVSNYSGSNIYCISECQNWEIALINLITNEKNKKDISLNFYVHAPIRTWDLRFHSFKNKLEIINIDANMDFKLNYFLICESDVMFFKSLKLDMIECVRFKALRYSYLTEVNKINGKEFGKSNKDVVGIIFDYSDSNCNVLIALIKKFKNIYGCRYRFIAKFHPANSTETKENAKSFMDQCEGEMFNFLESCGVVICSSSTSSSIDANYFGINSLTFFGDGFNLNSFDNLRPDIFSDVDNLYEKLMNYENVNDTMNKNYNPLGLYI
jgi:hypothetical protein